MAPAGAAPASFALRPLDAMALGAARAVVDAAAAGTPYVATLHGRLDAALSGSGEEARGLLAECSGAVAGVIIFGFFAGTDGAGRLHFVAVAPPHRYRGIGTALLTAAATTLSGLGARFLLAEVPDDVTALGDYWAFLAANGFREESRVSGLVREGIALAFLRRDLV